MLSRSRIKEILADWSLHGRLISSIMWPEELETLQTLATSRGIGTLKCLFELGGGGLPACQLPVQADQDSGHPPSPVWNQIKSHAAQAVAQQDAANRNLHLAPEAP
jgi:hypothetical protein